MKKLFSAATSLIMAASAVASTVVPFATGAADAKKSFELRAFEGASTTISADAINAGAVTVPVGVYYVESSADLQSLNFQLTVNGKTAGTDASGVKFEMIQAGGKVNSTAKEYKTVDGTFTTDILINFASQVSFDDFVEETVATAGGQVGASVAESNTDAGATNAYAGYAWTPPTGGYKWAGTTSDEYPVVVLNVTFPKGTAQGTYSVEFLDYAYDKEHPDNMSCMVESGSTKYTTKNSNLGLKNIDIVIGEGSSDVVTTTTTTQAPTVVTTTTTDGGSVTPTPSTNPEPAHAEESQFTPVDDFIIDLNNGGQGYTFTIDELKAKNTFNISAIVSDMGDHKSAKLIAKPGAAPANITITPRTTNYAYNNAVWELNGDTYYCNTMNSDGDADVIGSEKPIMAFSAAVDVDAIKPGTYTFTFARFDVAEDGTGQKEISPLVIPAVITITDGTEPVETTTTEPSVVTTTTTTAAPAVQTTTTTTATPASQGTTTTVTAAPVGDVLYGDANDNKVVNIADVVVLNKWLNNNADYAITAQGKINADCCDPKDGAEINASDSDAIIRSIVHRITLPTDSATLKADQAKN